MKGTLPVLRKKIDAIDQQLISTIAERLLLAQKIGLEKRKSAIPVVDLVRDQELQHRRGIQARAVGLDSEWLEKVFSLIIKESKKIQKYLCSHIGLR